MTYITSQREGCRRKGSFILNSVAKWELKGKPHEMGFHDFVLTTQHTHIESQIALESTNFCLLLLLATLPSIFSNFQTFFISPSTLVLLLSKGIVPSKMK